MAKAFMGTGPDINMNISADEIGQASVDISGMFIAEQYQVKRNCTKTDSDLKDVMDAHLKERASHYS